MMEKIILKNPGLYIATNNSTQEQFLVCISGKAPMLKVKNVLSILEFVNNDEGKCSDIFKDIEDNPDSYSYSRFECVSMPIVTSEEATYTAEEFQKYKKMYMEKILEATIINTICMDRDVEYLQAKAIWNQVYQQIIS